MDKLIERIKKARFVFVCGNGGSSATAEHLVNDLFSKGIKAICLNSNTSILTMIANDFGYPFVFSKQIELFGSDQDLLITISCSGTSPNISYSKYIANEIGMDVFSFPVFAKDRDYEKLEDEHLQLVHQIKKLL